MGPETQALPAPSEFGEAFKTIRLARLVFAVILAACIVVNLAAFVIVQFTPLLDDYPDYAPETTQPVAPGTDAAQPVEPTTQPGENAWGSILTWLLPAAKFVGLVSAVLLSLTILLGLKLCLLGRLGGVAGLVAAFFWSLILLAMLVPWQQAFPGLVVSGALYSFGELVEQARFFKTAWDPQTQASLFDQIVYYARFIAYPVVVLGVLVVTLLRFAAGARPEQAPPARRLEERSPLLRPSPPVEEGEQDQGPA